MAISTECRNAECHLHSVLLMKSAPNKTFMLSVVLLNVVMQSVIMLNVTLPRIRHIKFGNRKGGKTLVL